MKLSFNRLHHALPMTAAHQPAFPYLPGLGEELRESQGQERRGGGGLCPERFPPLRLKANPKFIDPAGWGTAPRPQGVRAALLPFRHLLPERGSPAPPGCSASTERRAGPGNLRDTAGPATEGAASFFSFCRGWGMSFLGVFFGCFLWFF